ncbi:Abhydrolase domain-containing protein [Dirofilaria immitis]|nr:Abhydrolase domain-containing protein [Dirofilaria immitis]
MNDEDLDDILKINGAGLPRDISVDRNEPKIIGFNYGSRKTTPFRYVNTMEEERPKFETMMKSEDKSQDDNNYDSENSEESSNEEILFGSKNDGNNKSKENSELNESDENYSDGVINANKYSAISRSESTMCAQLISPDTSAISSKSQDNNEKTVFGPLILQSQVYPQNWKEMEKVEGDEMTSWKRLFHAFKLTTKVCYILCPPVPNLMIRKAAFHPPKHCHYYFLIGGRANSRQQFLDAKSARGSINLTLCLPHLLSPKFKNSDVADQLLRIEVHLITSVNGDILVALYIRCEKSYQRKKSAPYILLFAQPNSSDIGSCMLTDPNLVFLLHPVDIADFLQCDLMAFDYSGFGLSTGIPTEKMYLIKEMKAQPNEIVLIGFSMGTAVAGLILIAPFTSLLRVLGRKPDSNRTCCLDQFSSIDKASSVACRTLICHGMKDGIVSINHSAVLQSRFPNATKPFYLDKATHQGIYCERKMWDRVRQFLFQELDCNKKWNEPTTTERRPVEQCSSEEFAIMTTYIHSIYKRKNLDIVSGGFKQEDISAVMEQEMLTQRQFDPSFYNRDLYIWQWFQFVCQSQLLLAERKQNGKLRRINLQTAKSLSSKCAPHYKLLLTIPCQAWKDTGRCNYGKRCKFAHGPEELRPMPKAEKIFNSPRYRTALCIKYTSFGYCPYGDQCHFIHDPVRIDLEKCLDWLSGSFSSQLSPEQTDNYLDNTPFSGGSIFAKRVAHSRTESECVSFKEGRKGNQLKLTSECSTTRSELSSNTESVLLTELITRDPVNKRTTVHDPFRSNKPGIKITSARNSA